MNEQLLKRHVLMFYPLEKKTQKKTLLIKSNSTALNAYKVELLGHPV